MLCGRREYVASGCVRCCGGVRWCRCPRCDIGVGVARIGVSIVVTVYKIWNGPGGTHGVGFVPSETLLSLARWVWIAATAVSSSSVWSTPMWVRMSRACCQCVRAGSGWCRARWAWASPSWARAWSSGWPSSLASARACWWWVRASSGWPMACRIRPRPCRASNCQLRSALVGEVEQSLVVVGGLSALRPVDAAEAGQRGLLADAVAGRVRELQLLLVAVGGLLVSAL
jgi:hypothetical protein